VRDIFANEISISDRLMLTSKRRSCGAKKERGTRWLRHLTGLLLCTRSCSKIAHEAGGGWLLSPLLLVFLGCKRRRFWRLADKRNYSPGGVISYFERGEVTGDLLKIFDFFQN